MIAGTTQKPSPKLHEHVFVMSWFSQRGLERVHKSIKVWGGIPVTNFFFAVVESLVVATHFRELRSAGLADAPRTGSVSAAGAGRWV